MCWVGEGPHYIVRFRQVIFVVFFYREFQSFSHTLACLLALASLPFCPILFRLVTSTGPLNWSAVSVSAARVLWLAEWRGCDQSDSTAHTNLLVKNTKITAEIIPSLSKSIRISSEHRTVVLLFFWIIWMLV